MAKHRNWLHMVQLKFFFSRLLNLLSKQNILLTIMLGNTYTFKILKSILELCVKFYITKYKKITYIALKLLNTVHYEVYQKIGKMIRCYLLSADYLW